MAQQQAMFEVKASQLPEAGDGVFATRMIPRGTRVTHYGGRRTTDRGVVTKLKQQKRHYYVMVVRYGLYIIGRPRPKSLAEGCAQIANDAKGKKGSTLTNNCRFERTDYHVWLTTKRDVLPGEELLVSYGPGWWTHNRADLLLPAQ